MSNTKQIPIFVDKELTLLFFLDMIHDFCDEYDLSKDFETDLKFLLLLFGSIFGTDCYAYIEQFINKVRQLNGTKMFSPSNFMDISEELAYDTVIVPKGRYFWGDPIVQNSDVLLSRIDSYKDLGSESSMMTQYYADWCVLQAGRFYGSNRPSMNIHGNTTFPYTDQQNNTFNVSQIQPIYIIEDATKSSKTIPILYAENINTYITSGANAKNVISLQTLPGVYDEANNTLIQGNQIASAGPHSMKAVNTLQLLQKNIIFQLLSPTEEHLFTAEMVNQSTNVATKVDIISLTTKILSRLYAKAQNMDILEFIRSLTSNPFYGWLAENWKKPRSGVQFLNLLAHNDPGIALQISDVTPIGDVFDSFSELYFGSFNQDNGTTSPNIAPNLIKDIKNINTQVEKSNSGETQINLTKLLETKTFKPEYKTLVETKILQTGYKPDNVQQLQFLFKNLSCKNRVCSYADVVSGSTNGENIENDKNIGWIARTTSTNVVEHVLQRLQVEGYIPPDETINEGLKQVLGFIVNAHIFSVDARFYQKEDPTSRQFQENFNIENLLNGINSTFEHKDVVSVQFKLSEIVSTPQKQIPSAVSVAGDFFKELIDQAYGVKEGSAAAKTQQYKQILLTEMNGPRKEGVSDKLSNIILQCMNVFISSNQNYVGNPIYQKLFLLLFQKTFSDFSQIVITNYLSKNKEMQMTNLGNYYPQSVWAISFDKMMTLIALYYGTNIIRQGVSQGPLNRGYVCYGFSNWALPTKLSQEEVTNTVQPMCSLTQLLKQKEDMFDIDQYPESHYTPGANILSTNGVINFSQGGKKRFNKNKKLNKTKRKVKRPSKYEISFKKYSKKSNGTTKLRKNK